MTASKAIIPTLAGTQARLQTPSVVMIALATVHAERMQQMLDGQLPFPPGRNGLDALTALRGWRGILAVLPDSNAPSVGR